MKTKTENYLAFLKELHTALKYTDKINMSNFMKRHNVSKSSGKPMYDGGIIKTNGVKAKGCRFYWVTPTEPNMRMAIELEQRVSKYQQKVNADRKKRIVEQQTTTTETQKKLEFITPKNEPKTKPKKVSIFWGLLSIEY